MSSLTLNTVSYSEFNDEDRYWALEGLQLGRVNLVVGRNATGKTRSMNVIAGLGKLLSGQIKELFITGQYEVTFRREGVDHKYDLAMSHKRVTSEHYFIGSERMLHRGGGGLGRIFNKEADKEMRFQSPDSNLAVVTKQDTIQHPFLTDLNDWGKSVIHLHGGTDMGRQTILLFVPGTPPPGEREADHAAQFFHQGIKKHPTFKQVIIDDMAAIGYEIEDIDFAKPSDVTPSVPIAGEYRNLSVKEKDLKCWTEQLKMSTGMFRALAQIITVNFRAFEMQDTCFVIDDVGEGLDHERSCALIDVLKARLFGDSQLVMTANNRFVMNRVPLEEWTVLQRTGGKVTVRNIHNSATAFEEFKFTGLSNFSLLETDFLNASRGESDSNE